MNWRAWCFQRIRAFNIQVKKEQEDRERNDFYGDFVSMISLDLHWLKNENSTNGIEEAGHGNRRNADVGDNFGKRV